jgi:glycosyltransferase involved in cell wall biosynthesis
MNASTSDPELRATLRTRGSERVRLFTWERAAKKYRALYRKVAGRVLSDEDRQLLTGSVTVQS